MSGTEWKPVVVGVDVSPESAGAAALGCKIAAAAGTTCHLVHGTRAVTAIPVSPPPLPVDPVALTKQLTEAAGRKVKQALGGHAPAAALESLEVRLGNGAWALRHSIEDHDAGLVVLGGKHHAPPARWLGGSTAHHAVRMIDIPLLISWSPRQTIRRVLVAVDLSYAAAPTLETAVRYAALFDAELRALHVVEDLPFSDELRLPLDHDAYHELSAEHFDRIMDAQSPSQRTERVVRPGEPARVIAEESALYDADLVVVGSHGKGWVDRLMIGSTTERLLNHLPTSLLVVQVRATEGDTTALTLEAAASA